MKKVAIILILLSVMACQTTSRKAAEYHSIILSEKERIVQKVVSLDESFEFAPAEEIENRRDSVIKYINQAIEKIEKLPPFKEDTILKDATLHLLNTYKSVVEKEYLERIKLFYKSEVDWKPDEQIKNERLTTRIEKIIYEALDRFNEAEESFMKKYNVFIEE